ncbi:XIAP-associated factor 1 [Bagarius yarrelli]|uniref:XIAP-associated factor 1 n=1 Tax=Bagarius yarrelli TaxID=175774 RepID=A0A556TRS8_BAGYA|nr:XIAP-associated factor 1 [Bagarius yarrelli]
MHEAHCKRFLCLCPDCKEQVPKDQLEEHRQEAHTLENECTKRLQTCEYCELAVPSSDLKEHVVACGSRTERCQDCNQYIMLKDQLRHTKLCTADDLNAKSSAKHFKPLFANTLQEFKGGNPFAESEPEGTILSLSDLQKKKKMQNDEIGYIDQDQINTCPYCHLLLPVKMLKLA